MYKDGNILTRIGFDIILLALVFVLPWWGTVSLAAVGIVAFSWYLEAVAVAFFIDIVFAVGWIPWLTIGVLVGLLVVELVTYYISH